MNEHDATLIGELNERVADTTNSCMALMLEVLQNINPDVKRSIESKSFTWFLEYAFFFLHVIDRCALKSVGAEKRSEIMDLLADAYITRLLVIVKDPAAVDDARSSLYRALNANTEFYAQFQRMFAESGEVTEGTLFFEHAAKLAEATGHSRDPRYFLMFKEVALAGLKKLDPLKYFPMAHKG